MMENNESIEIIDTDMVYVSNSIAVEPLIDQWYAWSHLIHPATAALNIKNRHLSIMNSYIQYPQAHAEAVKKPELLGGPFIDYGGERVDEVKALRDGTMKNCSSLFDLAKSIMALYEMLKLESKGYSLGPLYAKVPENLKGLVELYYDINSNPSFRFFEPLMYDSEFYDESLQTLNFLEIKDDSRSFDLINPRH
jgi:hypothetical protein